MDLNTMGLLIILGFFLTCYLVAALMHKWYRQDGGTRLERHDFLIFVSLGASVAILAFFVVSAESFPNVQEILLAIGCLVAIGLTIYGIYRRR